MKIITRELAKAQGLSRYYTGQPCKRGHIAERLHVPWNLRAIPAKENMNKSNRHED